MRILFAARYLAALVLYMYRREAFYARKNGKAENYNLAFGLPPYPSKFFDEHVVYFERCWDHDTCRPKSVIEYQMKRFTEAGV